MTEIRFFGKDGKYAIFSNFARTPLVVEGKSYMTSEHYFQSMKFAETDPEYAEYVRTQETAYQSKKAGMSKSHRIHPHWNGKDGQSIRIMRRVLFCKALQHKNFRDLLLSTGNSVIIEASPWDRFWGEGKDGKGKNMLGKLLMELRSKLKSYGDNMFDGKE